METKTVIKFDYIYAVTGTHHGSFVLAKSEGEARRIFHEAYKGENIIGLTCKGKNLY